MYLDQVTTKDGPKARKIVEALEGYGEGDWKIHVTFAELTDGGYHVFAESQGKPEEAISSFYEVVLQRLIDSLPEQSLPEQEEGTWAVGLATDAGNNLIFLHDVSLEYALGYGAEKAKTIQPEKLHSYVVFFDRKKGTPLEVVKRWHNGANRFQ